MFCHFTTETLRKFSALGHLMIYPQGAMLFLEEQPVRGVFVLCQGRVKLSTVSVRGKGLILKMAEPGAVLGLSAVTLDRPYELTAEAETACQVKFIDKDALTTFLQQEGEGGMHAARELGREYLSAFQELHDIVLAPSSIGKLARLLLSWTPPEAVESVDGRRPVHPVQVRTRFTHEEMAQMIGASRETVTRLLGDLRRSEVLELHGSTMIIRNVPALEALAQ
jgi:CRP/FNR family transcriptional regulator